MGSGGQGAAPLIAAESGSAGVAVIDDPGAAAAALDPVRSRILAELAREPASAAGLAARLGLPRQRLGYHLSELERRGLVSLTSQKRHGGLTERIFSAAAGSFVVSPAALGQAAPTLTRQGDRMSAAYLVAVASRAVAEVGALVTAAGRAGKRLPTMTADADIRFRNAADRAAFARDLAEAVSTLAARYHDAGAPDGRWYRVAALAHPRPAGTGAPDVRSERKEEST